MRMFYFSNQPFKQILQRNLTLKLFIKRHTRLLITHSQQKDIYQFNTLQKNPFFVFIKCRHNKQQRGLKNHQLSVSFLYCDPVNVNVIYLGTLCKSRNTNVPLNSALSHRTRAIKSNISNTIPPTICGYLQL